MLHGVIDDCDILFTVLDSRSHLHFQPLSSARLPVCFYRVLQQKFWRPLNSKHAEEIFSVLCAANRKLYCGIRIPVARHGVTLIPVDLKCSMSNVRRDKRPTARHTTAEMHHWWPANDDVYLSRSCSDYTFVQSYRRRYFPTRRSLHTAYVNRVKSYDATKGSAPHARPNLRNGQKHVICNPSNTY